MNICAVTIVLLLMLLTIYRLNMFCVSIKDIVFIDISIVLSLANGNLFKLALKFDMT